MKIALCFLLLSLNISFCLGASDVKTTFNPLLKAVIIDQETGKEIKGNIYPLEIFSSADNQWSLHANPALGCTEHTGLQRNRNLTYKILSEIKSMCNPPTGSWIVEPYQIPLFWNGLINWKLSRNWAVKFEKSITMGFEVETSVVKVRPEKGGQTYMMDIFTSSRSTDPSQDLWALTSDTLDNSLQSGSQSAAWMNTESKTIGGLSFLEIQEAIGQIRQTWQRLLEICSDNSSEYSFTDRIFEASKTPFVIKWNPAVGRKVSVWTPNLTPQQQRKLAYPQITYALPIAWLPRIFERLAFLSPTQDKYEELSNVVRFAKQISPILNEDLRMTTDDRLLSMKIAFALRPTQIVRINTEINQRTQKKFLEACTPILHSHPSDAQGLAYLFAFYAYQLFCNNLHIKESEPGPKPELGVMSRIPFSVMYRNLPDIDQAAFRQLITTSLGEFFPNKLRKYKTKKIDSETGKYVDLSDDELITLGDWYQSIIDKERDLRVVCGRVQELGSWIRLRYFRNSRP